MSETILFPVRLTQGIDNCLRQRVSRRGELADLLIKALETVDLTKIDAVAPVSVRSQSATSVKIPKRLHLKLKKISVRRSLSMNALLNGAIEAYCKENPYREKQQSSDSTGE